MTEVCDAGLGQAITALASHRISRNVSLVAVGLADGGVFVLRLQFSLTRSDCSR